MGRSSARCASSRALTPAPRRQGRTASPMCPASPRPRRPSSTRLRNEVIATVSDSGIRLNQRGQDAVAAGRFDFPVEVLAPGGDATALGGRRLDAGVHHRGLRRPRPGGPASASSDTPPLPNGRPASPSASSRRLPERSPVSGARRGPRRRGPTRPQRGDRPELAAATVAPATSGTSQKAPVGQPRPRPPPVAAGRAARRRTPSGCERLGQRRPAAPALSRKHLGAALRVVDVEVEHEAAGRGEQPPEVVPRRRAADAVPSSATREPSTTSSAGPLAQHVDEAGHLGRRRGQVGVVVADDLGAGVEGGQQPGRTASPLPRLVASVASLKSPGRRRRGRRARRRPVGRPVVDEHEPGAGELRRARRSAVGVEPVGLVEAGHDDRTSAVAAGHRSSAGAVAPRPTWTAPGIASPEPAVAAPDGGVGVEDRRHGPGRRPGPPATPRRRVGSPRRPSRSSPTSTARGHERREQRAGPRRRRGGGRRGGGTRAAGSAGGAPASGRGPRTATGGRAR